MTKTLNDYRDEVHAANKKWWQDIETGKPIKRNVYELFALVHSEASESLEGHRKNLQDDHIPEYRNDVVELCDVLIRIFDMAGGLGINLDGGIKWGPTLYDMAPVSWECWKSPPRIFSNYGEAICELHRYITEAAESWRWCANEPVRYINAEKNFQRIIGYVILIASENGMPLPEAFTAKNVYNAMREDHTHEHRRSEHGKKF